MQLIHYIIIRTRLICIPRYASHSTYLCPLHTDQRVSYLKLMEFDEPCLEWVSYMPDITTKEYPVLSWNVPLDTGTYCTLELEQGVAALTRIGLRACCTPRRRGVGCPVHTTGTLVASRWFSKNVVARHFKAIINMKTILGPISFSHPGVSC